MKPSFIIFILLFAGCSMENKKNNTTLHSYDNPAADADTSIKPVLKIGGCYAYEIANDSFACFLVFGVTKEDDELYYSFFPAGNVLKKLPTKEQFHKNGLWGRKIPMQGMDGEMEANLTFDEISIEEKNLLPAVPRLTLIDEIKISYKNEVGSKRIINSLNEIPESIEHFIATNKQMDEEISFFPQYPNEIVTWDKIILAKDDSEIPVPTAPWIFSKKTAHPAAVFTMTEEWYWDQADELSPFGNDDGSDALHLFKTWRHDHADEEPADFLPELENHWGISLAHMHSDKEEDLEKTRNKNPYYTNMDQAIIGVAFGQLVLEGKISAQLKELALKAIRRTGSPFTMKNVSEDARAEYKKRLDHMNAVLNRF
jgi:uncharacterized protein YfeS